MKLANPMKLAKPFSVIYTEEFVFQCATLLSWELGLEKKEKKRKDKFKI